MAIFAFAIIITIMFPFIILWLILIFPFLFITSFFSNKKNKKKETIKKDEYFECEIIEDDCFRRDWKGRIIE